MTVPAALPALIHDPVTTDAATLDVISPVDGAVVARIQIADAATVDAAVAAAREAFPAWAATPVADRAAALERLADLLVENGEEIAGAVTREMGMPIGLSRLTQVEIAAGVLRRVAETARTFDWTEDHKGYTVEHLPVGVVAAITPWNFPIYQVVSKVGPALAAGCTCVLKPSELAPTACHRFVELAREAGIPAGALTLVHGPGVPTGEALVGHRDVAAVSFTGSVTAGGRVAALAAEGIRRVALELGGKSAAVILDDADLDAVLPRAVRAALINSGQACNAPTRILIPREKLAAAETLVAQTIAGLKVGPPDDADLGPLANRRQHERVTGFVQRALVDGARVVAGSLDALPAPYMAPIALGDVDPDAEVAQEEIFGPVITLFGHDGDEHAVALANGTRYGLSAEIWGVDENRIQAVARGLRAGQVKVNGVRTRERPDAPFGGFGISGVGRELGVWGLSEFLEVKAVLA
jgi:acyl-CoA reductase-like NAD-dependent aldehyde dehydrogenase